MHEVFSSGDVNILNVNENGQKGGGKLVQFVTCCRNTESRDLSETCFISLFRHSALFSVPQIKSPTLTSSQTILFFWLHFKYCSGFWQQKQRKVGSSPPACSTRESDYRQSLDGSIQPWQNNRNRVWRERGRETVSSSKVKLSSFKNHKPLWKNKLWEMWT